MTDRHERTRSPTTPAPDWSQELRQPNRAATRSSSLVRQRGWVDFRALRSLVTIRQVLALVAWEPVGRACGVQLRGPCPVHHSGDGSRVLSVHLEKNIYRCFKCGSHGNQLDLYAAMTRLPLRVAAIDLCERLGIEPPMLPSQRR